MVVGHKVSTNPNGKEVEVNSHEIGKKNFKNINFQFSPPLCSKDLLALCDNTPYYTLYSSTMAKIKKRGESGA